jgi:hypothetical protein
MSLAEQANDNQLEGAVFAHDNFFQTFKQAFTESFDVSHGFSLWNEDTLIVREISMASKRGLIKPLARMEFFDKMSRWQASQSFLARLNFAGFLPKFLEVNSKD